LLGTLAKRLPFLWRINVAQTTPNMVWPTQGFVDIESQIQPVC
jgi:hypothetical protein